MAKKTKSVGVKSGGVKKTKKQSNSKGSGVFGLKKKSISKKSSTSGKSKDKKTKTKPKSSIKKKTSGGKGLLLQTNSVLIIIFFIIGLLTMATLALMMMPHSSDSELGASIDDSDADNSTKLRYCTTLECTIVASYIMKHMDPDVDPCDDFYKSACGKFSETHVPDTDQIEYSTEHRQLKLVDYELLSILKSKKSKSEVEKMTKRIFKKCLDSEGVDDSSENFEKKKLCLTELQNSHPLLVIEAYALRKIKPENLALAKKMAEEIKLELVEEIEKSNWIDKKSKDASIKALAKMKFNLGNLKSLNSSSALTFESTEKFRFQFLSSEIAFVSTHKKFQHIDTMFAGALLLRTPYLDVVLPSYHNLGASGALFGLGISYGLKNSGIKDFWSKESEKKYAEKTSCFESQYGKLKLHGHRVDGARVVRFAVANQVGLKIAYNAMKKNLERKDGDAMVKLPGLQNFSPEQMFFYSYANNLCANPIKSVNAEEAIDNRTPAELRVNAVLSNSAEFAKAFNCKPKSRMNLVKKCKIF